MIKSQGKKELTETKERGDKQRKTKNDIGC